MTQDFRPVWAEVDLDAIRHNVCTLIGAAAAAELLAVVKANAYGHGAVPVARAAIEAGATWLGVALVEEGVELRDAGIDARILVLSEPVPAAAATVVARGLTPVVYTANGIDALAQAVADAGEAHEGRAQPLPVHLKVDTGMHRVGCAPDAAISLIERIESRSELVLEGVCTHLAVADEPDNPYTNQQLDRFDALLAALHARSRVPPLVHAANSAGAIAHPRARFNLVRCGIAIYGIPPSPALAGRVPLRPALALKAKVSHVKPLAAGESVSYGRHFTAAADTQVATVPAGYADGVPRNLGLVGGQVLIGGRRHRIAGSVTMDQLVVDLSSAAPGVPVVAVDDEVVLIGSQGTEEITAIEWAEKLGIISYEVTTRLGPRVPRVYLGEA
ncbi:MAG: alanine racemase [Acidimicrobiia bacterium]|nr:alanine racemase [Acidimicrobiia bacterium]